MELVLAVLLVSSFTCVGLLALWAATSQRHWFVRVAMFVGVLSLLLLIPAYEPFVAFAVQGFVTALGFGSSSLLRFKQAPKAKQFGLKDLLCALAVFSVAAAISVNLPTLNLLAWRSVLLIGLVASIATRLSYWLIHGQQFPWQWRLAATVALAFASSLLLVYLDWFALSIFGWNGWPPERIGVGGSFWADSYTEVDPIKVWIPIVMSTVGMLSGIVWLAWFLSGSTARHQGRFRAWKLGTFGILALLLIPCGYVYFKLMTPLPIPIQELPENNGVDHLLAAGKVALSSQFEQYSFEPETVPIEVLQNEVSAMSAAYAELETALTEEIRVPIDYSSPFGFRADEIQTFRAIARCEAGRATLAIREGRFKDALHCNLNIIKLGYAIRREALVVNALVGIAVNGIGQSGVFEIIEDIHTNQSSQVIHLLTQLDRNAEPVEAFFVRERIFEQHSRGWNGHLRLVVLEMGDPSKLASKSSTVEAFNREKAISRLLCAELALRMYRDDHGHFPHTLAELVPVYLPDVPTDPFSPHADAIRYRAIGDEFVLYSVGTNGEDDGGIVPPTETEPKFWFMNSGDLRLQDFFAPDPDDP